MSEDVELQKIHQEIKLVRMMSRPVVVMWWFLILNIVLWVVAKGYGIWLSDEGLGSPYLNAEQLVFYTGMKLNPAIEGGQWWRLLSSQFVHLDMMHLLLNGYGIFMLGRFLERCYGARRMLVLYVASGTVGALASFLVNPTPAGGASGAVFGLVGGLVVFGIKYRKSLPPELSRALTVGLAPWVVLSVGVGFLDAIPMDNAAHIGGLVTGAVLALVMNSRLAERESLWGHRALWGLAAVVVAALVWMIWGWSGEAVQCLGSVDAYSGCYPDLAAEILEARRSR